MKVQVAQLCVEYDEYQRASRDPSKTKRRQHHLDIVGELRNEITTILRASKIVLEHERNDAKADLENSVRATAELAYFATWMIERGGWSGNQEG